jgi:hypothetical protein
MESFTTADEHDGDGPISLNQSWLFARVTKSAKQTNHCVMIFAGFCGALATIAGSICGRTNICGRPPPPAPALLHWGQPCILGGDQCESTFCAGVEDGVSPDWLD